ncbi:BRCA1-associated RING domain protein 1 isoform X2 [Paroedura picta]
MAEAREGPSGPVGEEALAALRRLGDALACSRCQNLLEKPVNLGNCEHVFCLACVGDCVGTACPVCHIPSMVQDVKVSRQLDNIARLYRKLQTLQGGSVPGCGKEMSSSPWEAIADRGKNRQIKMWFSPRSGKMRFQHLRKQPEKPEQAVADQESQPPVPPPSSDFPSLSQEPFQEAKKSQLK